MWRLKSCDQFYQLPSLKDKQSRTDTQDNKGSSCKDSVYDDDRHGVRYFTYNDVRSGVLCDEALLSSDKRRKKNSSSY